MTIRMLMCLLLFASSSCFGAEVEEALSRAGLVESTIPNGDACRAANRNPVDYVVANNAEYWMGTSYFDSNINRLFFGF